MLISRCQSDASVRRSLVSFWLLIICIYGNASSSEFLESEQLDNVEELAKHGLYIGVYKSELKPNELALLLCYRPRVAIEKVALSITISRNATLVFQSTRQAQSADDKDYFRFAFIVGTEYVEDSKLTLLDLVDKEGNIADSASGATIVPMSTMLAGAKRYQDSAWFRSCAQLAND